MNYSLLKECIRLCYDANIPLFVWGHTGLGKSSVINQVCSEDKMGFVDFRLSQVEAADLKGLPYRDEATGRTRYLPPAEMPIADMTYEEYQAALTAEPDPIKRHILSVKLQPRFKTGIVFLDELPRAAEDVQQASFQFVRDRRIGEYVLPSGWGIICAGNFLKGYQQSGFTDAAFLNRFCHVTLSAGDTTFSEWCDYMVTQHGDAASRIIEFTSGNIDMLDGARTGELDFSIQPSRRSWEMVLSVQEVSEGQKNKFSSLAVMKVIEGLVGKEVQGKYYDYNCPVKPRDIIEKGVNAMRAELEPIGRKRGELAGLTWALAATLRSYPFEEKYVTVALDFAEWMATNPNITDKDLCAMFCKSIAGKGGGAEGEHIRSAGLSNLKVQELINRVQKKNPKARKSFLNRLSERRSLQEICQKLFWGKDVDENFDEEPAA